MINKGTAIYQFQFDITNLNQDVKGISKTERIMLAYISD